MNNTKFLMVALVFTLCLGSTRAQVITSSPLGFNVITCPVNSDTIVGVPFRKEGSIVTATSGAPVDVGGQPDLKVIPLSTTLTASSLNQHYLKFNSGTRDGRWYNITANTTNSVTIDLNGDNLTGVTTGDAVVISEYWTLDTLFPPAQATTGWTEEPVSSGNFVPNGHAIVASATFFPSDRKTELLFPNYEVSGTNISTGATYYIYNGAWRKQGQSVTSDFGSDPLNPDYYVVIRQPSSVTHSTQYRSNGQVVMGNHAIPLSTRPEGYQDNLIGLPRAVDITLDELALGGTAAFVTSSTFFPSDRRDELLVFNNDTAGFNKTAAATYYYYNNAWRLQGQPATSAFGSDQIKAGQGFIIRKYQDAGSATAFWDNPASY